MRTLMKKAKCMHTHMLHVLLSRTTITHMLHSMLSHTTCSTHTHTLFQVLAKHCTFPELQELRLVNVRDMDDHHGVSKGCHVFRYPQLRKLELFDSVTDMTSCVSALTALTELRVANLLAHSRLTVAPEIGTLTNLQVLYMHAEYGCQIPQALCRLTQLRRLGLAGNCDMSQLDGSIKHLRQLQTLYLANMAYVAWNELIGQVLVLGRGGGWLCGCFQERGGVRGDAWPL